MSIVPPPLPPHHAPHAGRYVSAGDWMDKPQKEPLATWAAVQPERTALSDRFGILSYRELDGLVRRIACGLWGLGVRPGDVVAIQLPNRREFVLFQQAAARIGAAYLPLIMSLRAGDLKHILEACDARVMVVPSSYRGFDHAGMIADCRAYLPGLKHVFVVDAAGEDPANISLDLFLDKAWEDEFEGAVENLEIHPDSLRHILFTSGTESLPKGVLHSHNTTFFPLRRHRSYFGLGPEEAVFVATPVGHASGSLFGSELALFLGGKMVLQETWDREQALRLIAQEKCTIMWGATTFFVDLVNTELPAGLDLSAFRLACSAGAPIPRSLVDLVRQHLGARLISAYGSSEGHNVSIAMLDDPLSRVTDTDGRINPGIDWKTVDGERRSVPAGSPGELAFRGPNLCLGYLSPEHTQKAIDADGYFYSGDLVEADELGYIRVVGRCKDIIIRGGENISPAEIESILFRHPAVNDVAVFGIPDARLGERTCAAVIAKAGATPTLADFVSFLGEHKIAKFKYPEFVMVVEELPRTASGKVKKNTLRAMALGSTGTQS